MKSDMPGWWCWAKAVQGGRWRVIGSGSSPREAHRALIAWVKTQPQVPVASAVLAAGCRPELQDEHQSPPGPPDDQEPSGATPRASNTRFRKGEGMP